MWCEGNALAQVVQISSSAVKLRSLTEHRSHRCSPNLQRQLSQACPHLPAKRVLWDSRHVGGQNMETSSIPWLTPTCHQTSPILPGATSHCSRGPREDPLLTCSNASKLNHRPPRSHHPSPPARLAKLINREADLHKASLH